MKVFFAIFLVMIIPFYSYTQENITKSIKDFGAKGNGYTDDQDAFVKASDFFNKHKGHGKLVIPKGVYIVGRQKFTGNENDKTSIVFGWSNVLDLKNCTDLIIQGNPGAVLKHRDSLRIGTFSPIDAKPFIHSIKNIFLKTEYARYGSNVGDMILLSECSNISISGLALDGNVGNFKFGGNWGIGRNAYELIHYGINIIDSHDISVNGCNIKNFSCDGIYIANRGQERRTFKINIDKCQVNYCGRNGISWIGGENIRVSNSVFSNSGQGVVQESPCAGISIEVENNSFCRDGYFYNCLMENNVGSAIGSGSAGHASNVLFKDCTAASPVYLSVFVNAAAHVFDHCKFYGTVLVWYRATNEKDAVKFNNCLFDENYKGKKMYDGSYQLGIEATAVRLDSCVFRGYTTTTYYLKGLTENCDQGNIEKLKISNCTFYNYGKTGFKLALNTAGLSSHTVFYHNKFYTQPGISFQNGFNGNCYADAGGNEFNTINKK